MLPKLVFKQTLKLEFEILLFCVAANFHLGILTIENMLKIYSEALVEAVVASYRNRSARHILKIYFTNDVKLHRSRRPLGTTGTRYGD